MLEQREMALAEKRGHIKSAARSVYSVRLDLSNGIDCLLTVEHRAPEEINFDELLKAVNTYTAGVSQSSRNFEEVSDGIYDEVAKLYSERDIEVQIINNNSGIAFTKEYHTHKPYQSIAI
jgi:hypothetical protein